MEGIPMVAQAMLHREILHVHASLNLILHVLRSPFPILDPSFLTCVTCPHLQVQLRGLEASILQTRQVTYTALHYTLELLTTSSLMRATRFDSAQLAAELRGHTSFPDPRIFPTTSSSFPTRTTIRLLGHPWLHR